MCTTLGFVVLNVDLHFVQSSTLGFCATCKSRGGDMSTSECSSLSVENKSLEGFGMVRMFCVYSRPGIVLTAKQASNSSFYGQHFLV